jgi:hypothetical protein
MSILTRLFGKDEVTSDDIPSPNAEAIEVAQQRNAPVIEMKVTNPDGTVTNHVVSDRVVKEVMSGQRSPVSAMSVFASVLPAGTIPPSKSLPDGECEIKIVRVQQIGSIPVICPFTGNEVLPQNPNLDTGYYVLCQYPDGYERDHQVNGLEGLPPKIVANLRAVYGVESANLKNTPPMVEGETLVFEVKNYAA